MPLGFAGARLVEGAQILGVDPAQRTHIGTNVHTSHSLNGSQELKSCAWIFRHHGLTPASSRRLKTNGPTLAATVELLDMRVNTHGLLAVILSLTGAA